MTLPEIILLRARLLYARCVLFPFSRVACRLGIDLDAKGRRILASSAEYLRIDRPAKPE
jgi:hypothetical protein